jgi:hypothetical protein
MIGHVWNPSFLQDDTHVDDQSFIRMVSHQGHAIHELA